MTVPSAGRGKGSRGSTLCLLGLRCVGKSSVGRSLAEAWGLEFVDLDVELVAEWRRARGGAAGGSVAELPPVDSAGEILARFGEPAFRALELRTLTSVLSVDEPRVLATGGGVVETPGARALLARRARCLWLHAPLPVLAGRLASDPTFRPPLVGGDPASEMAVLFARREPLYRSLAGEPIDAAAGEPIEIARRIAAMLAE